MKITTKINLITTAWVVFVLLAVNVIVYISFMKISVKTEGEALQQKASDIIEEFNINDSSEIISGKLTPYLTNHSFIRIIQPHSIITNEVTSNHELARKIKGKFSSKLKMKRYAVRLAHKETQILVVRVPIKKNGQVVATLEIGEKLFGLELGKDILLSILAFCTVLGGVISLLGGRWLSTMIMKPISNMINIMEDIEQSGIPKRITIQKDTKDELQKMAETFNRMIGRLEANLEKQKQFISDASHEIKTPITVIKSYADLLRRRGIQNKEITLDAIETIYSEATRIQKMTERFLDLANTETENRLDLKHIHLLPLCENIVRHLKEAYNREIIVHCKQSSLMATADELKLRQAIIILLDNAMKYSTEKIDMYLDENKQFTIIRVKDYGIGIPEFEINNIFERFYRVDKARSRTTGGTGLGLSIAKNIIKQHNGKIEVKSSEGRGTEVSLFLPRFNVE